MDALEQIESLFPDYKVKKYKSCVEIYNPKNGAIKYVPTFFFTHATEIDIIIEDIKKELEER